MAQLDFVEEGADGSIEVALTDQYGDFDSMLTSELDIDDKQSSDSKEHIRVWDLDHGEEAANGSMQIMLSSVESEDNATIDDHTSDSSIFRFQGAKNNMSIMDDYEEESDSSSSSPIPRGKDLGSDVEMTHKHELLQGLDSFLDAVNSGTFLHGTFDLSPGGRVAANVIDVSDESLSEISLSSCHDHEHEDFSIMSGPSVNPVHEKTSEMKRQQNQRIGIHDHFSELRSVCSQTSLLDLTIMEETAFQLQELEGIVDDAGIVSVAIPSSVAPFPSRTSEDLKAAIHTKRIAVASDELSVSAEDDSIGDGTSINISHRARRARIERMQREVQRRYPVLLDPSLDDIKSGEVK